MTRLLLPLLALALLTAGGQVEAQDAASLFVDPAEQTVAPEDGAFEVRLMVDGVTTDQGLGGYTLVMAYDPSVVRGLTITDSGFVASTENPVICPSSAIDNDSGRLAHFCFTIPILSQPGPRTTQPQVVATIRFEPAAEGTTTLDISETTIIDPQGNGLLATTTDGDVTVRGRPAGPGPTQTPRTEPMEATPAENGTADTTDAATPDAALPASGDGPDGGTDRTGLYVALILGGIAGIVALTTVLMVRMRKRAS